MPTFKDYTIIRGIPFGGMTDLYVAQTPGHEMRVVLRLLKTQYLGHRRIRRQFIEGGEILAGLDHPNIVKLLDRGTTDGNRPYMALEYIEGRNLRELIVQRDPILKSHPLAIIRQMAEALYYVHTSGFLHFDFKPENLIVQPSAHVTLVDFDLAFRRNASPVKVKEISGTPAYLAPELIKFQVADESTDIFSFGVSCYELLTGRKPYASPGDPSSPAAPRTLQPDTPASLSTLVLKCLDKQPSSRYPSMSLVLKDLRATT